MVMPKQRGFENGIQDARREILKGMASLCAVPQSDAIPLRKKKGERNIPLPPMAASKIVLRLVAADLLAEPGEKSSELLDHLRLNKTRLASGLSHLHIDRILN